VFIHSQPMVLWITYARVRRGQGSRAMRSIKLYRQLEANRNRLHHPLELVKSHVLIMVRVRTVL
jgi:hypothetical protein